MFFTIEGEEKIDIHSWDREVNMTVFHSCISLDLQLCLVEKKEESERFCPLC